MFVPNKLVAAPKYIPSQFEIIKLSRDQNLYYYYVYCFFGWDCCGLVM